MSDFDNVAAMVANIRQIVDAKRADLVQQIQSFSQAHNEQAASLQAAIGSLKGQIAQNEAQLADLVATTTSKIQPLLDEFDRFEGVLAGFKQQAAAIEPSAKPTVVLAGAPDPANATDPAVITDPAATAAA